VVALLDHLGIPRAALVGFSMGGEVALRVALEQPDRVANVVVGGVGDSAELAGNDPSALLPYLRHGGWPGGVDDTAPIQTPVLLVLAANDHSCSGSLVLMWNIQSAPTEPSIAAAAEIVNERGHSHRQIERYESGEWRDSFRGAPFEPLESATFEHVAYRRRFRTDVYWTTLRASA
jgi:pimeloyl-ACP methyl ester carboxylesterase